MVVTVFEEEAELFELFESTNDEALHNYSDPLKEMDIVEKIALWELILSSTYFVDKNMQNAVPNDHKLRDTVQRQEPASLEATPESERAIYSYTKRNILYGTEKQARNTVFCQVVTKCCHCKSDYYIFYAYRRNSYFIGEFDVWKNAITLIGIAEPRAERKSYENQEELEESFRAQINTANRLGLRQTSPSNSPTKRHGCGIQKLKITQKVRLCGQVFGSKYYQDRGIKFIGKTGNVKEYKTALLVSFKSERFQKNEIYEHMIGCLVIENENKRVYRISNFYDCSDEQIGVFVLASNDEYDHKQYLDSYVTAVTVLMPTVSDSIQRPSIHA